MRFAFALFLLASPAFAAPAVVEKVVVTPAGDGWRFDVTLSHPDTGWDHYADGWEVVDAAGTVLGSRPLAHPHETEQPFTRATTVQVPPGVAQVFVRTRCNVDGWHEGLFAVTLPE